MRHPLALQGGLGLLGLRMQAVARIRALVHEIVDAYGQQRAKGQSCCRAMAIVFVFVAVFDTSAVDIDTVTTGRSGPANKRQCQEKRERFFHHGFPKNEI